MFYWCGFAVLYLLWYDTVSRSPDKPRNKIAKLNIVIKKTETDLLKAEVKQILMEAEMKTKKQ